MHLSHYQRAVQNNIRPIT